MPAFFLMFILLGTDGLIDTSNRPAVVAAAKNQGDCVAAAMKLNRDTSNTTRAYFCAAVVTAI